MLFAILCAVAAALLLWNINRWRSFLGDYQYPGVFQGHQYECRVGGLDQESRVLCMIGADESGLYLLPHPKKIRWYLGDSRGNKIFKKSLRIPWQDIACRYARVLFEDCIRFDLAPRKTYLYVPKDMGEKLLADAGRKITT